MVIDHSPGLEFQRWTGVHTNISGVALDVIPDGILFLIGELKMSLIRLLSQRYYSEHFGDTWK